MIDGIFAPILQGGNLISRNTLTRRAGTGGLVMLLAQEHLNVRLCGVVSHEAVRLLLPNGLRICMHEGVNHLLLVMTRTKIIQMATSIIMIPTMVMQ